MAHLQDRQALFLYDDKVRNNYPIIAGIDEAGRGPLAGPVVAAAVILRPGHCIDGLRDSKKVSVGGRIRLFWEVVSNSLNIGLGMVGPDEIDRTDILRSTKEAMKTAVEDMKATPDILLIDAVYIPGLQMEQRSLIRGESVSASIAAASIIAKTVRDDIMLAYDEEFPEYNFGAHKGYSTKDHMERLRQYGPCPIHRKSFKKVCDQVLPYASGRVRNGDGGPGRSGTK